MLLLLPASLRTLKFGRDFNTSLQGEPVQELYFYSASLGAEGVSALAEKLPSWSGKKLNLCHNGIGNDAWSSALLPPPGLLMRLILLSFTRHPVAFHTALLEGPGLQSCREQMQGLPTAVEFARAHDALPESDGEDADFGTHSGTTAGAPIDTRAPEVPALPPTPDLRSGICNQKRRVTVTCMQLIF